MKTTIKLRIAKRKDFLEFDKYKEDGKTRKYKMKLGVPYWMINSKSKIENHVYIVDPHTDLKSFALCLSREQILIVKSKYK